MAADHTVLAVHEIRRDIHEALYQLSAWDADKVRAQLDALEQAVERRVRQQSAREVYALKTPAPDGSAHYKAGWDDAVEAAVEAIRNESEQR